jgi:hypothetical protein
VRVRALAVASTLIASLAGGQTDRTGFSVVAGVGSGAFQFRRADLTDARIVSEAWMLRVGYAHSQHVTLGFELDHWSDGGAIKPAFTWYNAVLLGYPFVRGPLAGLYGKALFGLHHYSNRIFRTTERGWGAGLGYEHPVAKNVAIAAYADYLLALKASVISYATGEDGDVRPIITSTGGRMIVYGLGLRLR